MSSSRTTFVWVGGSVGWGEASCEQRTWCVYMFKLLALLMQRVPAEGFFQGATRVWGGQLLEPDCVWSASSRHRPPSPLGKRAAVPLLCLVWARQEQLSAGAARPVAAAPPNANHTRVESIQLNCLATHMKGPFHTSKIHFCADPAVILDFLAELLQIGGRWTAGCSSHHLHLGLTTSACTHSGSHASRRELSASFDSRSV